MNKVWCLSLLIVLNAGNIFAATCSMSTAGARIPLGELSELARNNFEHPEVIQPISLATVILYHSRQALSPQFVGEVGEQLILLLNGSTSATDGMIAFRTWQAHWVGFENEIHATRLQGIEIPLTL